MIRVAFLLGAMALAACAGDDKQAKDPLADVKDETDASSPDGETIVVEESATGGSESTSGEAVMAETDAVVENEPAAADAGAYGSGLKNLKIQEPVETIAAQPAPVPAKKVAAVAAKPSKFNAPKAAKATKTNGKHLWVFVDKLVVRAKPARGASQVGQVEYGVMVPVLETKDGYIKIGDNQWVARRFLTDRESKFIPAH